MGPVDESSSLCLLPWLMSLKNFSTILLSTSTLSRLLRACLLSVTLLPLVVLVIKRMDSDLVLPFSELAYVSSILMVTLHVYFFDLN